MSDFELLFLGTGTSAGVPMIGCHCEVCESADPHDKRTRPSVIISYQGIRVLVDTTPELRVQCLANRIDMIDAVVFTHSHADHIFGLDDVRRFNALKGGPLDIWADKATHDGLTRAFSYAFREPDPEAKVFRPHLVHRLIEGPFQIGNKTWQPVPLEHANGIVSGYRIDDFAYCTDVSGIPDASYALLDGVKTLVISALHHKPHPAHFSLSQAMEAATRIGASRVFFTHMGHGISHAKTNADLPPHMRLAHDGLRIRISEDA